MADAPQTPRKGRSWQQQQQPRPAADEVKRYIDRLNEQYDLAIACPDVTQSPSKRRQLSGDYHESNRIWSWVRCLYFHDPDELERCLRQFAAHAATLRREPRDSLPSAAAPLASRPPTQQQRAALRTILSSTLSGAVSSSGTASVPSSSAVAATMLTASSVREPPCSPKRASEDHEAEWRRKRIQRQGSPAAAQLIDAIPFRTSQSSSLPSVGDAPRHLDSAVSLGTESSSDEYEPTIFSSHPSPGAEPASRTTSFNTEDRAPSSRSVRSADQSFVSCEEDVEDGAQSTDSDSVPIIDVDALVEEANAQANSPAEQLKNIWRKLKTMPWTCGLILTVNSSLTSFLGSRPAVHYVGNHKDCDALRR